MGPHPESRRRGVFWSLVAAYLAVNVVARWLAWTLFHGHGVYGWERPGPGELSLAILSAILPAALAGLLGDFATGLGKERSSGLLWNVVPALALLACLEADMAWVHFSQTHIAWRDVHMFLTESWADHFGLRTSDFVRHMLLIGVHGMLLVLAWQVAGHRIVERLPRPRRVVLATAILSAFAIDFVFVARHLAQVSGNEQWTELAAKNPLRIRVFDGLRPFVSSRDDGLAAARSAMVDLEPADRPLDARTPGEPHDILMIVIESFAARFDDAETMPYLAELGARGLRAERHYSVGNCTHYGILGLLFGEPVTFYRGVELEGLPQSPFIEALREDGFESRYVGSDLTSFRHVGEYMRNFTREDFRGEGPELITVAHEELAREGSQFLLLFYGDSHYPYPHSPEFAAFQPEVSEDFDYTRWDLRDHTEGIVNRYRNALAECDSWLRTVLARVDLENTIVVITGDHGQEFFENGRLAHGSALDDPQLRVPLVLLAPGLEPRTCDRITSHADVFPTIFDQMGLDAPQGILGRSLLREHEGVAIAAQNEHTRAPKLWCVITEVGKGILRGDRGEPLTLRQLANPLDEPTRFVENDEEWLRLLAWGKRLELGLSSAAQ